jgi:hypothetical protein
VGLEEVGERVRMELTIEEPDWVWELVSRRSS